MTVSAERLSTRSRWRARLHEVIFEADTPAGRAFDVGLLVAILVSVVAVMLESVPTSGASTVACFGRWSGRSPSPSRSNTHCGSWRSIVRGATPAASSASSDLLAVVPTYLALVVPEAQSLMVIRAIRLLRVFRILKLAHFLGEAQQLVLALRASRRKITVFLGGIVTIVVIMGALMYIIEGEEHGFTSIPTSMYWAVVTMTTVGYGDIAPKTPLGQLLAAAADDPRLRHHRGSRPASCR